MKLLTVNRYSKKRFQVLKRIYASVSSLGSTERIQNSISDLYRRNNYSWLNFDCGASSKRNATASNRPRFVCETLLKLRQLTHESSRVVWVRTDFTVDFDQTLHHDFRDLGVGQSVLQPVTEEDDQGKRLSEFVRPGGRSGGVDASQLVQHPCLRRIETLQVLFRSSGLENKTAESITHTQHPNISFPCVPIFRLCWG